MLTVQKALSSMDIPLFCLRDGDRPTDNLGPMSCRVESPFGPYAGEVSAHHKWMT